jgi:lipid A ethanolaminephosphotransferase
MYSTPCKLHRFFTKTKPGNKNLLLYIRDNSAMFLKSFRSKKSSLSSNKQTGIHPSWLIVLSSLWLASIGNVALWQELVRLPEMNDWRAVWFGVAFAALIAALICMLMSLLCWRWTLKPMIALFLTSAAFGAYFMLSYRVVIDSSMIVNVLQTDLKESLDLFSWKLVIAVLFLAVLPIVVLWKREVKQLTVFKAVAGNAQLFLASCVVAAIAVFPIYQDFASSMRNNMQLRFLINPLNNNTTVTEPYWDITSYWFGRKTWADVCRPTEDSCFNFDSW